MGAVATARARWGDSLPDWVLALAEACDQEASMAKVGKRIGYTKGSVSQVIRNQRKPGSLDRIRAAVRAEIMAVRVDCPALGEISQADCRRNAARPYANTNSVRVALWRACQGCEHNHRRTS